MPPNNRSNRWRQRWRRLSPWTKASIITGVIVGVTGSVTGIRAAWSTLVLGLPAPIFYVDNSIGGAEGRFKTAQQSQTSILRDLQIEATEGKKSSANNALANWKLEKLKTKDPVTSTLIDQQINEKEGEIGRLNEQLRTLNRLKAQGQ